MPTMTRMWLPLLCLLAATLSCLGGDSQSFGPAPGASSRTPSATDGPVLAAPVTSNQGASSPKASSLYPKRRIVPPGATYGAPLPLTIVGPDGASRTLPAKSDPGGLALTPPANQGVGNLVIEAAPGVTNNADTANGDICIEPDGSIATVPNGGTPSIYNPVINLIYWGTYWPNGKEFDSFWQQMANTPAFWNRLAEYGVAPGSWGTSGIFPTSWTGSITEAQFQDAVTYLFGGVPPNGTNLVNSSFSRDIYVIFLPSGTYAQVDGNGCSRGGVCGHHGSYVSGGITQPFAVVDGGATASTWQFAEKVASHEIIEATTDPDAVGASAGNGWLFFGEQGSGEIADPCAGSNIPEINIAGLPVQRFWSGLACRCVGEKDLNGVDVTGYGSFDYTVYSPSKSIWYAEGFSPNWHFGLSDDIPFAGDFDGDGITEFALLRHGSPTHMLTLNILSGEPTDHTFGATGDVAVPGDYDNPQDGETDLAVWQPSLGWRWISSATGVSIPATRWGRTDDVPVQADYDNDGTTDFTVFRPSTKTWYVLLSSEVGQVLEVQSKVFEPGDIPVAGDFNGDGYADWALWRPSNGTWYVGYNNYAGDIAVIDQGVTGFTQQWGTAGDVPIGRDVDGDWETDLFVWRPSTGHWFYWASSTWTGVDAGQWGNSANVPIGQTSSDYGISLP
jgi:hypothetical protein